MVEGSGQGRGGDNDPTGTQGGFGGAAMFGLLIWVQFCGCVQFVKIHNAAHLGYVQLSVSTVNFN